MYSDFERPDLPPSSPAVSYNCPLPRSDRGRIFQISAGLDTAGNINTSKIFHATSPLSIYFFLYDSKILLWSHSVGSIIVIYLCRRFLHNIKYRPCRFCRCFVLVPHIFIIILLFITIRSSYRHSKQPNIYLARSNESSSKLPITFKMGPLNLIYW